MTIAWTASADTETGRVRKGNEDAFRVDSDAGIFLVADGMGGHAAGEVASRLAADATMELLLGYEGSDYDGLFREAFEGAHRAICDCCENDPATAGMGTTLTVVVLHRDGTYHAGHIGDSRLYHLSGETLLQKSVDHTWVQREVDEGRVKADRAHVHPLSHILTRVLSDTEPPLPDFIHGDVRPGDALLLCTDGLHNMLDDEELLENLLEGRDADDVVDMLIDSANDAGGVDNITAVIVRINPE